jgi:SpoVK/Ycf46/Vps4 family AAA+-type ATPase
MFFDTFDEIPINKKICLTSKNTTTNTSNIYILELSSYTSTVNEINKFIDYCLIKYKKQINSEPIINMGQKLYKYVGMNNSTFQCIFEEYSLTHTKSFDNIFFKEKEKLVNNIKYFCSNEDTYNLLGRPWTCGIMMYGSPGTGKTSCIKAISQMTQRQIIDISLNKIKTKKELNEIFYNKKINGNEIPINKRLYVLEELDCIIHKFKDRKLNEINIESNSNLDQKTNTNTNINRNGNLNINQLTEHNQQFKDNETDSISLDDLLCLLDGNIEMPGRMLIATTNYIEFIDKALIRPGRFDYCIKFNNADYEIIIQIINHFSKKNIKKLKKKKISSGINVKSSTSTMTMTTNKFTLEHVENIKKHLTYNDKLVWSPAKISQICLTFIDSPTYYDDVVNEIVSNYDDECKLL